MRYPRIGLIWLVLATFTLASCGVTTIDQRTRSPSHEQRVPPPPPPKEILGQEARDGLSLTLSPEYTTGPSNREQYMLELLNRMRMDPTREVERILSADDGGVTSAMMYFNVDSTLLAQQFASMTPSPPLAWNDKLHQAAEQHNNQMLLYDTQSHQLPGEPSVSNRVTAAGYTNWSTLGENVYAYSESVFYGHAGFAVDWGYGTGGMQTPPGHRNNMMNSNFKEIGISVIDSLPDKVVGPLLITQDLGARFNSGIRLLGVVVNDANGNKFYDEGEGLADVNVNVVGGGQTYSTKTLAAGGYQIMLPAGTYDVVFSGGGLALPAQYSVVVGTSNVKLDVGYFPAPTPSPTPIMVTSATSLTASAVERLRGQTVTFTARVTSHDPMVAPNGSVEFVDGDTVLATKALAVANSIYSATYSYTIGSSAPFGTHNIIARYKGNARVAASESLRLALLITNSKTVLSSSLAAAGHKSVLGQRFTLTATVSASPVVTLKPTGDVVFYDGANPIARVPTTLVSGIVKAVLAIDTLAIGSHSLSAVYQGDTSFQRSTSATISHLVNPGYVGQPAMLPFADDFNRLDSTVLGVYWTQRTGNFDLKSNGALAVGTASAVATLNAVFNANVAIEADLSVEAAYATQFAGVFARFNGASDKYLVRLYLASGKVYLQMQRYQSGVTTITPVSVVVTSRKIRVKLSVYGSTIELWSKDPAVMDAYNLVGRYMDPKPLIGKAIGLQGYLARIDNIAVSALNSDGSEVP